jgi:hypothetical protein
MPEKRSKGSYMALIDEISKPKRPPPTIAMAAIT